MTKRRQIRFTIIRSLVAIFIALFVATVLIFISASGNTFHDKLTATGEALKQMLVGPLFRFSKKNGTSFEAKRLDICPDFEDQQKYCADEAGKSLGLRFLQCVFTSLASIEEPKRKRWAGQACPSSNREDQISMPAATIAAGTSTSSCCCRKALNSSAFM